MDKVKVLSVLIALLSRFGKKPEIKNEQEAQKILADLKKNDFIVEYLELDGKFYQFKNPKAEHNKTIYQKKILEKIYSNSENITNIIDSNFIWIIRWCWIFKIFV